MLFNEFIQPTILYQQDAKGAIREWTISNDNVDIVITYGTLHGAMQEIRETITRGKASRNIIAQIQSRMESRINKQLLKGYKYSIEEAQAGRSNALGFIQPMLALPIQKVKDVDLSNAWVQMKYDGNRCLITKQGSTLIAYTKNGKIIDTIGHILSSIDIPDGTTLDGELYCHGYALQKVVSWVKRKQANTYRLKYHIYDIVSSQPFEERLDMLRALQIGQMAEIVPTWHISEIDSIQNQFIMARDEGYEGLIVRTNEYRSNRKLRTAGYEDGKRSKSLLKVKQFLDDEFKVTNIERSEKGRTVCWCLAKNGKPFKVSPPGTFEERQRVYDEAEKYVFKTLRVEYSILTADGIPFHGVATEWRNKEAE